MTSYMDLAISKLPNIPNMVVALPEWQNFEVCVTNLNLPTQKEKVSPNLKELKGKDLDELLRKHKLKISGKVSEKRERLLKFYKIQAS